MGVPLVIIQRAWGTLETPWIFPTWKIHPSPGLRILPKKGRGLNFP